MEMAANSLDKRRDAMEVAMASQACFGGLGRGAAAESSMRLWGGLAGAAGRGELGELPVAERLSGGSLLDFC